MFDIISLVLVALAITIAFATAILNNKITDLEKRVKELEDFINRMYKYNG